MGTRCFIDVLIVFAHVIYLADGLWIITPLCRGSLRKPSGLQPHIVERSPDEQVLLPSGDGGWAKALWGSTSSEKQGSRMLAREDADVGKEGGKLLGRPYLSQKSWLQMPGNRHKRGRLGIYSRGSKFHAVIICHVHYNSNFIPDCSEAPVCFMLFCFGFLALQTTLTIYSLASPFLSLF